MCVTPSSILFFFLPSIRGFVLWARAMVIAKDDGWGDDIEICDPNGPLSSFDLCAPALFLSLVG